MTEILTDLSPAATANAMEANLYAASPFSCNLPNAEVYQGPDISWVVTDIPLLPCNIVFRSRLKPEQADGTIASLIEKARRKNVSLRWLMGNGSAPTDLGESLIAHGFTTSGATPSMAIDLLSMRQEASVPSHITITEIRDNADFDAWCHIAAVGFGIPPQREPAMSRWFGTARSMKLPMRFYLALQNGEPVATSQLFPTEGVAGIYYVATMPQARNQGIGYAITLKALQDALEMGYRVGVLQASKMGKPIYRRMGFNDCGEMNIYQWRNPS